MHGPLLQLQRGVGEPAEGDRQPEVDGPVGQDGRQGLSVGQPEAGQQGDEDELDHTEAARGDGDGSQDVGQAVGGQQVDRGDDVAEGGHEHPQRRRVQQPVCRRPPAGPPQEGPVVDQHGEPGGQPLHQRGEPVGVEEPDVGRHRVDDPAGPLLAPGQQVEEAAERPEQDHAHRRGHQHEDGGRGGAVPVEPARYPEPVEHEERDERAPEQHVEDHRRPDPLGAEGEPGVGAGHAGLGQQPVPEGCARCGPPGRHVAEGQGGQVDPEQPEPARPAVGEHGVGELRVCGQGGDLQQHPEGEVGDVDVGEGADLVAVGDGQRQRHVEHEEEGEHGADADAHLTAHEGPTVPPPAVPRRGRRTAPRHVVRRGSHRIHVGTARPSGPVMLSA